MRFPILLLAWSCIGAFAQQAGEPFWESWEHIGMMDVNREPATWTSPETMLHDLQSTKSADRGKAMRAIGVLNYLGPGQAELRYASLGDDGTRQAILVLGDDPMVYAAIAIPFHGAWRRIAVFHCWCKYDDWRLIDDFAQFESTMVGGMELVLHASGGGTGLYVQTEARFRLHNGAIKNVISFTRRKSSCPPIGEACDYERRWFDGNQLIEGRNPSLKLDGASILRDQLLGWEAWDSALTSLTCTPYKWDAATFAYTRSGTANPCKYKSLR